MIIGISGYKGSGKNTLGAYIAGELALNFHNVEFESFAKGFKESVKTIFNWTDDHTNGPLKEVVDDYWGITPRQAMQTLGTEWGRELISEDIWINSLWKRIEYKVKSHDIIITDVRFDNEIDFIKKNDGIIINVMRTEGSFESGDTHVSETGITETEFDYNVLNNGSLHVLQEASQNIVQSILTTR